MIIALNFLTGDGQVVAFVNEYGDVEYADVAGDTNGPRIDEDTVSVSVFLRMIDAGTPEFLSVGSFKIAKVDARDFPKDAPIQSLLLADATEEMRGKIVDARHITEKLADHAEARRLFTALREKINVTVPPEHLVNLPTAMPSETKPAASRSLH